MDNRRMKLRERKRMDDLLKTVILSDDVVAPARVESVTGEGSGTKASSESEEKVFDATGAETKRGGVGRRGEARKKVDEERSRGRGELTDAIVQPTLSFVFEVRRAVCSSHLCPSRLVRVRRSVRETKGERRRVFSRDKVGAEWGIERVDDKRTGDCRVVHQCSLEGAKLQPSFALCLCRRPKLVLSSFHSLDCSPRLSLHYKLNNGRGNLHSSRTCTTHSSRSSRLTIVLLLRSTSPSSSSEPAVFVPCAALVHRDADRVLCHSWGKRNTSLILPTNSSLSVTLSQDHLRSLTSAKFVASGASQDRLWLNGEEEEIKDGGRTARCLEEIRSIRKAIEVSLRRSRAVVHVDRNERVGVPSRRVFCSRKTLVQRRGEAKEERGRAVYACLFTAGRHARLATVYACRATSAASMLLAHPRGAQCACSDAAVHACTESIRSSRPHMS